MALSLEKAANDGNVTVIKQISPIFLDEWKRYKALLAKCLFNVEDADIISEDNLIYEDDLISEDDLINEEDLISEDDLIDEEDLISEDDLIDDI